MQTFDFAIVGGGVLGASFASALLAEGRSVALFERWTQPGDASVRNFGLAWPFIVPGSDWVAHGLRTREIYRGLAEKFEFDWNDAGAMVVASTPAEAALNEEFAGLAGGLGLRCEILDGRVSLERQPILRSDTTRNALYFPEAAALNPRRFVAGWLTYMADHLGLRLETPKHASMVAPAGRGAFWVVGADSTEVQARDVLVCSGEDFQTLFPRDFRTSGLVRCKLQMMQTRSAQAKPGPALAFGRSMRHYALFRECRAFESVAMERTEAGADLDRLGVHLLVKTAADGSLVLGDSHEDRAGDQPRDFDYQTDIENHLLTLAQHHLTGPEWTIHRRWLGYYARHPSLPVVDLRPGQRVRLISGLTCGMSAGPGYAEARVREWLSEA